MRFNKIIYSTPSLRIDLALIFVLDNEEVRHLLACVEQVVRVVGRHKERIPGGGQELRCVDHHGDLAGRHAKHHLHQEITTMLKFNAQ